MTVGAQYATLPHFGYKGFPFQRKPAANCEQFGFRINVVELQCCRMFIVSTQLTPFTHLILTQPEHTPHNTVMGFGSVYILSSH
jgi:hypothetical protein